MCSSAATSGLRKRIVGDHLHAGRLEHLGDVLADLAQADDAEGLAVQFRLPVKLFLSHSPLPISLAWAWGDAAGDGEESCPGVCSAAETMLPSGGVHHDHAGGGGRGRGRRFVDADGRRGPTTLSRGMPALITASVTWVAGSAPPARRTDR